MIGLGEGLEGGGLGWAVSIIRIEVIKCCLS
jgi:hypothetical protein